MDDRDRENVTRMLASRGRFAAGFWGIMWVLSVPGGLAMGQWWILPAATLNITGSMMLWRASGQHVLPVGRASEDAAYGRANRRRLVAFLLIVAGTAVGMICARVFADSL